MKKFAIRAISGIIYAAVIIFCIIKGDGWLLAMSLIFSAMGIIEFDRMNFAKSITSGYLVYDVLGVAMIVLYPVFYPAGGTGIFMTWLGIFLLRMVFMLFNPAKGKTPSDVAAGVFGQLYIGIPFALTVQTDIRMLPLLVFALLWLNDSGAYIVGSRIGRHKMSPTISPKKTWEGLAGGVVIAIAGMLALRYWGAEFFGISHVSILQCLILALVVCVFGTLGDLLESLFKRAAGVKDSGKCIPGHGGILDRIDSYLLAFPATYLLLYYLMLYYR